MTQKAPLIVVIGATACGKSRLAIELARRFNGEIISADSMQVYKGLDIVTNKVTEEEQKQAKHHMINLLDPMSRCSVSDFRDKSLDIISQLHKQNKLPIIVGGTNYYIESLLWKAFTLRPTFDELNDTCAHQDNKDGLRDRKATIESEQRTLIDRETSYLQSTSDVAKHTEDDLEDLDKFFFKRIYNDGFKHIESDRLWKILEQVDPRMAHLIHLHDKRKIVRILQVIQQNKRKQTYSDLVNERNRSQEDQASLGGPLRFVDTCVLWLHCDQDELDKIMDKRVDTMLERGLLAELEQFHKDFNEQRLETGQVANYQKGIFQSIGFKEFHKYLLLSEDEKSSDKAKKILKISIEQMKISTRKYARRQLQWIRRRFMQKGKRELPVLYKFQAAFNEADWIEQVQTPAMSIVENFLKGDEISEELLSYKQEPEVQAAVNNPGIYYCEVCDRTLIGTHYIEEHLQSRSHRRNTSHSSRGDDHKRQKIENNDETNVATESSGGEKKLVSLSEGGGETH